MSQVKFTDDDLKRFKESIVPGSFPKINGVQATALLSRLEAAEEIVRIMDQYCCETSTSLWLKDAVKAWKKVAGK